MIKASNGWADKISAVVTKATCKEMIRTMFVSTLLVEIGPLGDMITPYTAKASLNTLESAQYIDLS
jgi:hypothetical protein